MIVWLRLWDIFVTIECCFSFFFEGFEQWLFAFDDVFADILFRLHNNGLTGFPLILYDLWLISIMLFVLIGLLDALLLVLF